MRKIVPKKNEKSIVKRLLIAGLLCFVVAAACECALTPKAKYPPGRDTVESFGDGTYQLQKSNSGLVLRNCAYRFEVASKVIAHKCSGGTLYVIGLTSVYVSSQVSDYILYAEISLDSYALKVCLPPEAGEKYTDRIFQKMADDGKAILLSDFSQFSSESQAVFAKLKTSAGIL